MNKQAGITLIIVSCAALVGVGALIDAVGGVTIRTNVGPDKAQLTVYEPLLPGTQVRPTWTVSEGDVNREVKLLLITEGRDYTLVSSPFRAGGALVVIPCGIVGEKGRLELVGAQDRGVISSVAVEFLPAGPDCVR